MAEPKKEEEVITKPKRKLPSSVWKPGQSGNIHGRPKKGSTMVDALNHALEEELTLKDGTVANPKELIAQKLIEMALKEDNVAALRYIFDRICGSPIQSIAAKVEGDMTVTFSSEFKDC
jgi:hypothetical protein